MGYNWNESLKVGVGMMTRGEVALIVAQKGLSVGMLDAKYFASVILLIIVSSVTTPIVLKLLYRKSHGHRRTDDEQGDEQQPQEQAVQTEQETVQQA